MAFHLDPDFGWLAANRVIAPRRKVFEKSVGIPTLIQPDSASAA
jgi:hypothetical protein